MTDEPETPAPAEATADAPASVEAAAKTPAVPVDPLGSSVETPVPAVKPGPLQAASARAEPAISADPRSSPARSARPDLTESIEPLYREAGGFRLRLEPADLARLRELPGSKGRTDRELGEEFFEKQAERFVQSLSEDVTPPAEVRVVVDPYSRQAFLAIERRIRSILSF